MGAINLLSGTPDDLSPRSGWTTTWAAAPQLTEPDNLPPAPFTHAGLALTDCTLRQTVYLSIGGDQLRLRFSNAFGRLPLRIGSVSLALPVKGAAGASVVRPATCRQVLFGGRNSVTVPPGSLAVSDPVRLDVTPRSNLTVTAYLPDGMPMDGLTSHPGSRTTSHLMAGDAVADPAPGPTVPVEHWYLLSAVEVVTGPAAFAVVMLGDSLTDGRGSTTDGNDRWPDLFTARLHDAGGAVLDRQVAVVNQAAGGNRVLADGVGPSALSRLDRDVLTLSGVRHLVVFEGVNDLGQAEATELAQRKTVEDLLAAYRQIALRAHALGITVHGATVTPFGGNGAYDDPAGVREKARQVLNAAIRSGLEAGLEAEDGFDGVLDFDQVVRDPADPRRLLPVADEGDHLHLSPEGYRMLAEAIPLEPFTHWG